MPRGVNKAIIIGTLGRDPEVKYTAGGSTLVNMSIATNETWKDRQTGQQQERTEWHRIVIFGKLADVAAQYLRKGAQVYIEGRLSTRKWQGRDGQDRYTTEIIAQEMEMLGGRASERSDQPAPASPQQPQPAASTPPPDDGFDDIPF